MKHLLISGQDLRSSDVLKVEILDVPCNKLLKLYQVIVSNIFRTISKTISFYRRRILSLYIYSMDWCLRQCFPNFVRVPRPSISVRILALSVS